MGGKASCIPRLSLGGRGREENSAQRPTIERVGDELGEMPLLISHPAGRRYKRFCYAAEGGEVKIREDVEVVVVRK